MSKSEISLRFSPAKCSIKTMAVLISTKRMMEIRLDSAYWYVHTEIKLRKYVGNIRGSEAGNIRGSEADT